MADPISATDPATARPLLVCFSHLRWNFVFQRPQHLLKRAARSYRVVFIEEPVFGDGPPRIERRLSREGVEVAVPSLPHGLAGEEALEENRRLVRSLLGSLGQTPNVAWYYTPMAMKLTREMAFPLVVYDCMDELAQFKGASPEIAVLERELLHRADLVFTGGTSLFEAKRRRHPAVHCFPSSVDIAHFKPARDRSGEPPGDLAAVPSPRIGYFGVIDERIDLPLIADVAAKRPDWQLVMIGPTAKIDVADLPRAANIHWLGMKSYDELPAYLGGLDVGWMPFAINDATRFISPTKTPEFLAAGVPVVATPVADVVRSWGSDGLVSIAGDPGATVSAVETALSQGLDTDWLARVDAALARSSWDETWRRMQALIDATELAKVEQEASRPAAASG
jgi:glycosyltransferase involved in cell wall biosynthesis